MLFADLVGFTAHTERSDPEDVRARLTRYHEVVRDQVEGHGGRIEKLMGDGVFAVFGVPAAHEDDPERAVRAALRVQAAADQITAEGLDIAVRIAVTTGEAVVQLEAGDREGIVGDVVNTASRLEALAPPGGVVVDQRTYLSARGAIEFTDLEPVIVKGKAEPLAIWLAVGATSRFGVAFEDHETTPFVGREREHAVLKDAFERVVAEETIQLVTIAGEPGAGKSRLVRELFSWIDDYPDVVWWRQGRCLPYGEGITFWAIAEVLKAQAGILDGEPPGTSAAKLRTAVGALIDDEDDARWIERTLGPLVGVTDTGAAEQGELFAAARAFFETMADRRPLVLVLEDMHWADPALVGFVEHLLDWASTSPILLVCTARPEIFADHPDWGGGKRNAITISLSPLSDNATATLLAGLLPAHLMDASTQHQLLERCGGNPLYAIEYARLAAEGGVDGSLPASVEALIAARLDLLSPEEKSFLQAAAVVGRVFWAGAVDFMLPDGVRDSAGVLRSLVGREMIRSIRRSSMQGQDEFAFWHVLVRDVAYGQIPRAERARLHEAVATWIEAAANDRLTDVAELLLHHYGETTSLSEATGTSRPDLAARAYRFAMMAAERARNLDAERALDYYRRAIEFASTDTERGWAQYEFGNLSFFAGRPDDVEAAANEAVRLTEAAGDDHARARALGLLASLHWLRGDRARSDTLAQRAIDLVADAEPDPMVAETMVGYAASLMLAGRHEEGFDWAQRGLAMARSLGDARTAVRGASVVAGTKLGLGDMEGLDMIRDVIAESLDRGFTHAAITAYNNLTTTLQYAVGPDEAIAEITKAIDLGDKRGHQGSARWSRLTRLEHYALGGRLDDLEAEATRLIEWDDQRGGSQVGAGARGILASSRLLRGNVAEAWAMAEPTLEEARKIEDPQVLAPALAVAAAIAHETGAPDTVQLVEEFLAVTAEVPEWRAGFVSFVTEPLVAHGRLDLLERLTTQTRVVGLPTRSRNDAARARLAEAHGDLEEAVGLLQGSIALADDVRMDADSITQRIQLARCLAMAGAEAEAASVRTEARRRALEIDAGLLLAKLDELDGVAPKAAGA